MRNITDPKIDSYCTKFSSKPSKYCKAIFQYTQAHIPYSQMLIGEMEASFLAFLIKLVNAKRVLEIGCFTGYSALVMAEAMPPDGRVITLDINPRTGRIARRFWQKSPAGSKIELILGDAKKSLRQLKSNFDFVFIDADKTSYHFYLKEALKRLRSGGMIAVDNCLWSGRVLDKRVNDADTKALKEFNRYVSGAKNLIATLVPIRDGIFLIQKK